jgi:AraC family transcriptional regulator, transcriptional activator of the genes for pyochelin and ferripyochelin receptors
MHPLESGNLLLSRRDNFAALRSFFTRAEQQLARETPLLGDEYVKLDAVPGQGRGWLEFLTIADDFFLVVSQLTTENADFNYIGENWIRFCFNVSGTQSLLFDGQSRGEIGQHTAHLMVHPEGVVHTDRYFACTQARWVSILCRREHLTGTLGFDPEAFPSGLRRYLVHGEPSLYVAQRPFNRALRDCIGQFFHTSSHAALRRLYLKAKAYEALYTFLEDCAADAVNPAAPLGLKRRDIDRLYEARAILQSDPAAEIHLAQLARRVGLNRNKLSRGFHVLFGTTILEFSRTCRLMAASELLRETDLDVQEVGRRCGYRHASSFSAAFKAQFRMSPAAARRRSSGP